MNRENSTLLSLPAELRLRIYTYVLHFSHPLYRPLRASIIHPWHSISDQNHDNSDSKFNSNSLADTALLLTNRQIHHEAKDCFYELNSFRVSFNHLCSCQNIFPYPAFDDNLVRRLEIRSFLPRSNSLISKDSSSSSGENSSISSTDDGAFDASDASSEEEDDDDEGGQEEAYTNCKFCQNSGMGLIDYLLHDLPKLHAATIAFEDIFTFSESIGPILRKLVPSSQSNPNRNDEDENDTHNTNNNNTNDPPHLISNEIGTLRLEGLPRGKTLEFHLPSLTHAWRALAGTEQQQQRRVWDGRSNTNHRGNSRSQKTTHTRLPGQKILSRALEYLHFEANSYDRVPAALRRFFVVVAPPPLATGGKEGSAEEGGTDYLRQTAQLHFRSLPDGRERRAAFTIALARELAKVFEDDGGAGSIEWVPLDAEPEVPVWRFGLDVDVQEDEREAEWEDGDGDGVGGARRVGRGEEEEEMEIWRVSRRERV
ncbi:hypothetical protein KC343_g11179 [Hortaea werneckii]|uniref:F-box domain-containing protein n=1 Tax=Hortaea werneckii TaxID=91943 RepID=A0A3M7EV17_HORWE|nr:hypothetical protein KC338_g4446 [Hortaea werneckii]KAI7197066.1 hypothetical protein KC352_g20666 [Hortaea werneckii]KAI7344623.1 hypothetical protein KC320_g8747 [Hortaea werneckii]KAI7550528.1 hypothetical protein KC317_g14244 [Hortaea werneckii]KAI7605242.1 hypothetical protein KC346_g11113 [Hortaea werneckii]